MEKESKFKFPTEMVELPSKGLLYPEGHPLSSGKVEVKYMTAREEDILTNQNYIKQGIVIDKLLQSLIITKFDFNDLLVGDKNAILVAARVLGYGKDYDFTYEDESHTVDLSALEPNELFEDLIKTPGENSFEYELPHSKNKIKFKLLNGHDEIKIESDLKGYKKINKNASPELSTRIKHQIIEVNGEVGQAAINDFVDNYMLARDSASFRAYYKKINPDVKMVFYPNNGDEEVAIPMEVGFLWPDARV
jgi:hypothetical protein